MKSFPMFIRTTGRRVVIAGGGEQAAQKARLILKTDARIVLAASEIEEELAAIVRSGTATWHKDPIDAALFEGAAMAFVATGCPGSDAALHALANAARCPVNVVDQPELCDLTTPSLVDRDPVVVAIGTEGTAPVLARQIKTGVEEMLAPNLGGLAAFAGRLRGAVAARVPREHRRAFWRWVFAEAPRNAWSRGADSHAIGLVKQALHAGRAPDTTGTGSIALVGAGPGARDLLTLRAVQRLQEADVIYYDRLVDPEALELARRDAGRVFVGKVVGAHAWPQDRINDVIIAAARQGKRVVRLKSGDPSVFARAGEEIAAAEAANIPIEVVPGITAACAMAATTKRPLTERGVSDSLILTTGQSQAGDGVPDSTRLCLPGTTTAFYMSVGQAARIQSDLLARGVSPHQSVQIAADISKATELHVHTTVGHLANDVAKSDLSGCAVIMLTWPKTQPARAMLPANMAQNEKAISYAG
ncbi:siroheme synthase CysG [uncultured Roseobacter sp.]|uniref:siroheme synthase CysG n=1 Tax=uncultured Roseobacter sp. TaxID=114847 RepID=UPI00261C698A|nr:siroheme synthase CysG [uncultured Roseobacter sp.]